MLVARSERRALFEPKVLFYLALPKRCLGAFYSYDINLPPNPVVSRHMWV